MHSLVKYCPGDNQSSLVGLNITAIQLEQLLTNLNNTFYKFNVVKICRHVISQNNEWTDSGRSDKPQVCNYAIRNKFCVKETHVTSVDG